MNNSKNDHCQENSYAEIKKVLNSYRVLKKKIEDLTKQLGKIKFELEKIYSHNYSPSKLSEKNRSKINDLKLEKLDLKDRIERLKNKSIAQKMKIERKIDLVQDEEATQVLELYYIKLLSIKDIAGLLFVSEVTARRRFSRGVHLIKDQGFIY